MNISDHILKLAVKKIINEASEEELHELDALFEREPEVRDQLKIFLDWWYKCSSEEIKVDDDSLFKKIMEKIHPTTQRTNDQ